MAKLALLVARVSTVGQEDNYSPETQFAGMRKYAAAIGAEIASEILDVCSGAVPIFDRPGGKLILTAINARSVDTVIFYTIDRASRDEDVIDFIMLKRELRAASIELHFADTGRSDHDSVTGIIEYIRVSEAGRERKKIIERTMRGKQAKAASGQWVGNSHPPFGYRRLGRGRKARLAIDAREAAIVRRIFDLFLGIHGQPLGIQTIAATLTAEKVPPPSRPIENKTRGWYITVVKTILRRRAYIGEFESYGFPINLPDLAIIDSEAFAAVQERMARSRAIAGVYQRKYEYLLTGRITCACGKGMMSSCVKHGRYLYYRCYSGVHERHLHRCAERHVPANIADRVAWDWLHSLLCDEMQLEIGLNRFAAQREGDAQPKRDRVAQLESEIAEFERQIRVLAAEVRAEKDEFVAATLREQQRISASQRTAAKAARSKAMAELTRAELTAEDRAQIKAWAAEIREEWGELTFEQKRTLLAIVDFHATVEYHEDVRGLCMTCGLNVDANLNRVGQWASLEKAESLKCTNGSNSLIRVRPSASYFLSPRPATVRTGRRRE